LNQNYYNLYSFDNSFQPLQTNWEASNSFSNGPYDSMESNTGELVQHYNTNSEMQMEPQSYSTSIPFRNNEQYTNYLPQKQRYHENASRKFLPDQEEDLISLLLLDNQQSPSVSPFSTLSPAASLTESESAVQSHDEILEEIQRECAEIERRSQSASPPDSTNKKIF